MDREQADDDRLSQNPLIRRRALGAELRRIRIDLGLTAGQVADAIDRSSSWISRLESGKIGIRTRELHELLDIYRISNLASRHSLESMAVQGRQRAWWSSYRDVVGEAYAVFIGIEDSAQRIFEYQERVVPGLLQTERYMRALFKRYGGVSEWMSTPAQIERLVEVRLARQGVLRRASPPALRVVIDESVVWRSVGDSEIHREQLEALRVAAECVEVRILPFVVPGGPSITPSFTMLGPHVGIPVVCMEVLDRMTVYDGAMAVPYVTTSEWLTSASLSREESLHRISQIIQKIGA